MIEHILKGDRHNLKIQIPLEGFDYIDLYDELVFSEWNLGEHIEQQAGRMGWWIVIAKKSEVVLQEQQEAYKVWYAETRAEVYEKLTEGKKKPSIADIEQGVIASNAKAYLGWQQKLARLKAVVEIIKEIPTVYREKGAMLVQASKFRNLDRSV